MKADFAAFTAARMGRIERRKRSGRLIYIKTTVSPMRFYKVDE